MAVGCMVGRQQGRQNRQQTAAERRSPRSKHRQPLMKHAFVHTVVDDHSRVAYAESHDDETAATAAGVLRRAVFWFAARGVLVERVLTDNGSCYRSKLWRRQCKTSTPPISAPGPTGHRPTARSSASTTR